jgi:hypothetical protein
MAIDLGHYKNEAFSNSIACAYLSGCKDKSRDNVKVFSIY